MFRVLLRLRKGPEVKYISHRDLIRAFEFALRRARIPVAYSTGFNPRPRMSFGSAIGVGVTSEDERILLELTDTEDPSDIRDRLNGQLPRGIQVLSVEVIPEGQKNPLSYLNASEFRIVLSCEDGCTPLAVRTAVEAMLAAETVKVAREREGNIREIDLRPYLVSADVSSEDGNIVILVGLSSGTSGGAGPKDFLSALNTAVPGVQVKEISRVRQFSVK